MILNFVEPPLSPTDDLTCLIPNSVGQHHVILSYPVGGWPSTAMWLSATWLFLKMESLKQSLQQVVLGKLDTYV